MAITLREITPDNYEAVIELKVAPGQENFVAPNVHSLAEAKVFPGLVPLAIYNEELPVGFTMYGIHPESKEHWIIRLMVDAKYQGNGYGRSAMQILIQRMRLHTDCRELYVSYEPDNAVAARLYSSLGFQPTGRVEGGETVVRLSPVTDLHACPRCGETVGEIRWGQTDCPRCGLHFECC
jgi:diamine N-acetyltransferase